MLHLDGAAGEGGGQILRTALTLSMCTGRGFRITDIRARRSRPGLQPQHLAAVRAAAALCNAQVQGDHLGAEQLVFEPGPVRAGSYRFDIGTAGSTGLLLQTVLPALQSAAGPSQITVIGGTHNPQAPPFEFLAEAFLPLVARLGARVSLEMIRAGFYPVGGGEVRAQVEPGPRLSYLELVERGRLLQVYARSLLANLPEHIGQRELNVLAHELGLGEDAQALINLSGVRGAGNAVIVGVQSEAVTEVFTALGRRGLPAEAVAGAAAQQAKAYLALTAPVGEHLGDQLLLPLSLGNGGRYRCTTCSSHMRTNSDVVHAFLPVTIRFLSIGDGMWEVVVQPSAP